MEPVDVGLVGTAAMSNDGGEVHWQGERHADLGRCGHSPRKSTVWAIRIAAAVDGVVEDASHVVLAASRSREDLGADPGSRP